METVAGRSCGPDYPRHLFEVQQVDLATGTAEVATWSAENVWAAAELGSGVVDLGLVVAVRGYAQLPVEPCATPA